MIFPCEAFRYPVEKVEIQENKDWNPYATEENLYYARVKIQENKDWNLILLKKRTQR